MSLYIPQCLCERVAIWTKIRKVFGDGLGEVMYRAGPRFVAVRQRGEIEERAAPGKTVEGTGKIVVEGDLL